MKWRGKLNLKTGEKSGHTVLWCSRPNNVSCKNHSSTWISIHAFQKRPNEKKNGRPSPRFTCTDWPGNAKHFALCSEHFELSYFSRSVLIGTTVDFRRFYLEQSSVPSIYTKPKDSLDTDYSRNEGRLANRFFPRNLLWTFFWDPAKKHQYPKSQPPPPPKKKKLVSFVAGFCYK